MKQFSCGDVVAGCQRQFTAPDEPGILTQVAAHAHADHNLTSISAELADQVRGAIITV